MSPGFIRSGLRGNWRGVGRICAYGEPAILMLEECIPLERAQDLVPEAHTCHIFRGEDLLSAMSQGREDVFGKRGAARGHVRSSLLCLTVVAMRRAGSVGHRGGQRLALLGDIEGEDLHRRCSTGISPFVYLDSSQTPGRPFAHHGATTCEHATRPRARRLKNCRILLANLLARPQLVVL
jgi:hypothetical protein